MSKVESRVENGYLIVSERGHPTHRFEILEGNAIPLGYEVWSIGNHMPDGWLPLCRLCQVQPFEGATNIEVDTLKAIRCEGAQMILSASVSDIDTLEKAERFIKKYDGNPKKQYELKKAKAALPYMRQLKWN